jgi:hypothetical protein
LGDFKAVTLGVISGVHSFIGLLRSLGLHISHYLLALSKVEV